MENAACLLPSSVSVQPLVPLISTPTAFAADVFTHSLLRVGLVDICEDAQAAVAAPDQADANQSEGISSSVIVISTHPVTMRRCKI